MKRIVNALCKKKIYYDVYNGHAKLLENESQAADVATKLFGRFKVNHGFFTISYVLNRGKIRARKFDTYEMVLILDEIIAPSMGAASLALYDIDIEKALFDLLIDRDKFIKDYPLNRRFMKSAVNAYFKATTVNVRSISGLSWGNANDFINNIGDYKTGAQLPFGLTLTSKPATVKASMYQMTMVSTASILSHIGILDKCVAMVGDTLAMENTGMLYGFCKLFEETNGFFPFYQTKRKKQ